MSIDISGKVAWLFPIVVGQNWPEGDEDKLLGLADAYDAAGEAARTVVESGDVATRRLEALMLGDAGDEFSAFWSECSAEVDRLVQTCADLADSCHGFGLDVEYTKALILVNLEILAAEITYLLAMGPFTFGASTAAIPAAQAATRVTVQIIFAEMLRKAAEYVAVDLVIQGSQVLTGHRSTDEWDFGKSRDQAVAGAGAGFGDGLGGYVKASGWEPQTIGEAAVQGSVQNMAGEAFARTADDAAHGRLPDLEDARAVAVGSATGLVSGGASQYVDDALSAEPDMLREFLADAYGAAAGSSVEGAAEGDYDLGTDDIAAGTSTAIGGVGQKGREAVLDPPPGPVRGGF